MGRNQDLQRQLRDAGTQNEGTAQLLLQAAEEIHDLRRRLDAANEHSEALERGLIRLRQLVDETMGA